MGTKGLAIYQPIGKQTMLHRAEQTLRLPQAQLMVLCLLMYFLFVKVYRPLLHSLTIIGRLVFYWVTVHVTGIFILWHCSLKVSSAVHLILVRKLWRKVLAPIVHILWHSRAAVRSFGIYLASALQDCAAKWALGLLLVLLKRSAWPAVSSTGDQLHHSVHPFFQGNTEAYQAVLRPVMKQIVVSLFLGFLDGIRDAFRLAARAVKYVLLTRFFYSIRPTWRSACKENTFEDITRVLPHSCIPLCTRFNGPATSILKDIPQSFAAVKFVVAMERVVSGPGKYGLDATNIPLHMRFQSIIGMKNASSMQETDATVKRMKVACVVFITLYLSMLSSVIKNIK